MERGVIKWFNQVSDYGFIAPDEGGPDRYMRGGNFAGAPSTLREGLRVTFEQREGGMGPEAIKVRRVTPIRRRSTGSFEPARRRGPHDSRFPHRHATAPCLHAAVEDADGGLSWSAFEARYFPNRTRHNLEALKAFESYRNRSTYGRIRGTRADDVRGLGAPASRSTSSRRGHGRLPVTKTVERQKAQRLSAAAVSNWEAEGGALP
jgi:CspA family cold shock protein